MNPVTATNVIVLKAHSAYRKYILKKAYESGGMQNLSVSLGRSTGFIYKVLKDDSFINLKKVSEAIAKMESKK